MTEKIIYNSKIPMIWIPDEVEVWKLYKLIRLNDEKEEIIIEDLINGNESIVSNKYSHPLDITHLEDLNDLCGMNNLHEAPLLSILKRRFFQDKIYTNTGNVLISINPYKSIPGIYNNPLAYLIKDEQLLNTSSSSSASTSTSSTNNNNNNNNNEHHDISSPHVFKVANNAFNCVVEGKMNQSVIVSGESGAGKTEASKYVMQFLINANEKMASSSIGEDIKQVLLDSNAIFESFGNSKTVRNDNSSRFGKYIKLQYNSDDCLISAFTETFLLEKSRLSYVGMGERNYHIFYQLIRGIGASSDYADKSQLYLTNVDDFTILTSGGCTILSSELEDITEFNHLHSALATMGASAVEIHHIWEILSCILHIGNIQCSQLSPNSNDNNNNISSDNNNNSKEHDVKLHSPIMPFDYLAQLLGVDPFFFADRLIHHHVKITSGRRMSTVVKKLNINDVKNNLLGLNKWLYSSLFSWLVKKVNHAHLSVSTRPHHAKHTHYDIPSTNNLNHSNVTGRRHSHAAEMELIHLKNIIAIKFIGILDIFGFEILAKNSFEQLCINFANERLQQQFNEHVFVNEQLEYEREGLNWSTISYQDNQHVIDLISKKPSGLLVILEEYGMLNRAPDDKALLMSFNQAHDITTQSRASIKRPTSGTITTPIADVKLSAYAKPRFGGQSFVIKHFAGDVEYSIDGFLIKNNDALQDDIMEVLMTSTNTFLLNISEISINPEQPGYLPEITGGIQSVSKKSTNNNVGSGNKKMASSSTVSLVFRSQLDDLMSTLRSTHPHYIKCIKPNTKKTSHLFEAPLVMQQLRYSGALEVVRIRREGFPQRSNFKDFYDPYQLLSNDKIYRINYMNRKSRESLQIETIQRRRTERKSLKEIQLQNNHNNDNNNNNIDDEEDKKDELELNNLTSQEHEWKGRASDLALTFLSPEEYQVGHAKLFLREGAMKTLNLAMKKFLDGSAAVIQALCRMKVTYRRFEKSRLKIILIQSLIRRYFERKKYKKILYAIKVIQWFSMGNRLRKEYLLKLKAGKILLQRLKVFSLRLKYLKLINKRKLSSIKIQSIFRSLLARKEANKRRKAIILIQSIQRRRKCQQKYLLSLSRVIKLQSHIRKHIHQRNYKNLIQKYIIIQSLCRKIISINRYRYFKKSIIKIQTISRKHQAIKKYNITLRACILIQSLCRMLILSQYKKKYIKSTIKLQSFIRKKLAIKHYNKSLSACILIQSLCRMIHNKELYYLKKKSAIKIETIFRKHNQMKKYSRIQHCCILIQSLCRMNIQTHKFHLQKTCAIKLQKQIRRKLIQENYKKTLQSCIKLQSIARMLKSKKQLLLLKQYKLSTNSCIIIQSFFRMNLIRLKYLKTIKSIIILQKLRRGMIVLKNYKKTLLYCIKIQSLIRKFLQRIQYLKLVKHCIILQSFGRQINNRRQFLQIRQKVIFIQSIIRSFIESIKYKQILNKCIKIQSIIRMSQQKIKYNILVKYCKLLQAFGRQINCRRYFLLCRNKAIKIQSYIRSRITTKKYQIILSNCILIQSLIRKFLQVKEYNKIIKYCIKLQSFGRQINCQNNYYSKRLKIICIQSYIRTFLLKLKYKNISNKVIKIQSIIRKFLSILKYKKLCKAILLIQSEIRGFLYRYKYKVHISALLLIQSIFRMYLQRKLFKEKYLQIILIESKWRSYKQRINYLKMKQNIILIESKVRSFLKYKVYQKMKLNCKRIQKVIKLYLRNLYLNKSLTRLFYICTNGQGSELDNLLNIPSIESQQIKNGKYCSSIVPYNSNHLRDILSIRNRKLNYATILQTAISTGNLSVVKVLSPTSSDILAKDKNGNTAVHYISMYPSIDMIEYLAECLQIKFTYNDLINYGILSEELNETQSSSSASSPITRKLYGRRASFMALDDDSDDDGDNISSNNNNNNNNTKSSFNNIGSESFNEKIAMVTSGECIKQGWLKKRRVGGRWQKRWSILTQTGLSYYKKKGDQTPRGIIPIEGSTITRLRGKDPIFVINNERLVTKKRHEGKSPIMEFQPENEKDLQEWLLPLRALAGTNTGERGFRPGLDEDPFIPITYINTDLRVAWLNETNNDNETPLMILCRFRNRNSEGNPIVPTARVLQLAMWLSLNGCSLNMQNKLGQTALHIAIRYGNLELANCLISRGADTTIRNNEGKTIVDLSPTDFVREIPGKSIFRDMQQTPILGLNRLRGYSYLTIHFQKHSQTSTSHREDFESLKLPFLVISVYNQRKKLVESIQHMPIPVIRRSSYVWWGCVWHMQTPLENVEEGTYILIELKNALNSSQILFPTATPQQSSTSSFTSFFTGSNKENTNDLVQTPGTLVSWHIYPINLTTINSIPQTLEFNQPPILLPSNITNSSSSSSSLLSPKSSSLNNNNNTIPLSDMTFLEVNHLICKRGKDINLIEYRRQPDWISQHLLNNKIEIDAVSNTNHNNILQSKNSSDKISSSSEEILSIPKLLSLQFSNEQKLKALPIFTIEQIQQLSIKDLKYNLGVLGIDYSNFVEKSEMRDALMRGSQGLTHNDSIASQIKYAS